MGESWDVDKPLRKDEERRAAQVEIDVIGRRVPKEIVKADVKLKDGVELSAADRMWTYPHSGVEQVHEYPFSQRDRESYTRINDIEYRKE